MLREPVERSIYLWDIRWPHSISSSTLLPQRGLELGMTAECTSWAAQGPLEVVQWGNRLAWLPIEPEPEPVGASEPTPNMDLFGRTRHVEFDGVRVKLWFAPREWGEELRLTAHITVRGKTLGNPALLMRAQDILQAAREWADEPESFQFALYSRNGAGGGGAMTLRHTTWASLDTALPSEVGAEARDFIRQITAGERHQWRRQEATYAALKEALGLHPAYGPKGPQSFQDQTLRQWSRGEWGGRLMDAEAEKLTGPFRLAILLCELEASGTGGPHDMGLHNGQGDRSSARMPWAQALGKGRARATDGPAWTAAISDAALVLRRMLSDANVTWAEQDDDLLLIGGPFAISECKRRLRSEFLAWRQIDLDRAGCCSDWEARLASYADKMADLSVILEELIRPGGNFARPQASDSAA